MMNHEPSYTIQEVSREMELPSSTLRYYEEIGLLEPIARAKSGHRQYTEADLRRLTMIKMLRLAGMSIEQMQGFVELYKGGAETAHQRRKILQAHRELVQAHVDALLETLDFIDYKISLYKEEEKSCEREHNNEVQVIG